MFVILVSIISISTFQSLQISEFGQVSVLLSLFNCHYVQSFLEKKGMASINNVLEYEHHVSKYTLRCMISLGKYAYFDGHSLKLCSSTFFLPSGPFEEAKSLTFFCSTAALTCYPYSIVSSVTGLCQRQISILGSD